MEIKNKTKYDWITLKQSFFNSDDLEVRAFIRRELGVEIDKNGAVDRATRGWTEEKKAWKQKRLEEAQKEADRDLAEKLKITLEDLLINKKLLFSLDAKYLECWAKMVSPNRENPLNDEDKAFMMTYQSNINEIYKRIQIELSLPIHIEELQGVKDKPLVLIDLMRMAERATREAEERENNRPSDSGDPYPPIRDGS